MSNRYVRLIAAFVNAYWILWFRFPKMSREQKLREIQQWSQNILKVIGIHLQTTQRDTHCVIPPARLLVTNHVSWVDILVIQALQPSVFVAKEEVRQWPVIGSLAKACGVVFVNRNSMLASRRMVDEVANAMHHGYQVACFPEGTSSDGQDVKTFHANVFEAAIQRQSTVQTMAVRYQHAVTGELCTEAAFTGDMGFVGSLRQVLRTTPITVTVSLGPCLSAQHHSRRTLAQISHQNVKDQLRQLVLNFSNL